MNGEAIPIGRCPYRCWGDECKRCEYARITVRHERAVYEPTVTPAEDHVFVLKSPPFRLCPLHDHAPSLHEATER